jgi:two-component system sensor histidine kinase KdpD
MKSQFVATVSHELRTPLTSIRGAIAAARRPVSDEQRAELFDVVERQTDRLATMVEEMFAAAQLERHGSAPLLRRIELASLVRLVALDSQVAGRPVKVEAPETCEVRADPEAMRRIVTNLVENAHKYGAAPIRLIVEPDGDRVMLSVVDSGPGVPMAEREKIFERFYRAEHTRDNRPGIGLGLPIVRGLAEACGGSVWVEDAPGGGAAFRVSLRTRHADDQEAPWPASPRS